MLGDIPHQRHQHHPDEERADPPGRHHRLHRPDQEFAQEDGGHGRPGQHPQGHPHLPGTAMRRPAGLPRLNLVVQERRGEGEEHAAQVKAEEDAGHAPTQVLQRHVHMGAVQVKEEGGDAQADDRQGHHGGAEAGQVAVEELLPVLQASQEHAEAENQEEVPQNRPGDGGLDQFPFPGPQSHDGDDQFGGVAQGGVEKAPNLGAGPLGQVLGGLAQQAGQRDKPQGRGDEDGLRPPGRPPEGDLGHHGQGHKDQEEAQIFHRPSPSTGHPVGATRLGRRPAGDPAGRPYGQAINANASPAAGRCGRRRPPAGGWPWKGRSRRSW